MAIEIVDLPINSMVDLSIVVDIVSYSWFTHKKWINMVIFHRFTVSLPEGIQGAKSSRHPRCPHSTPRRSPLSEGTLGRCPLGSDPSRRRRGAQAAPAADRLRLGRVDNDHGKKRGKPWKTLENHGKTMENNGKPWKNIEKQWKSMENHGKTMEKPWKTMEKPWKTMENHGKTMENHMENTWKNTWRKLKLQSFKT